MSTGSGCRISALHMHAYKNIFEHIQDDIYAFKLNVYKTQTAFVMKIGDVGQLMLETEDA